MNKQLAEANNRALEIIEDYQHIRFGKRSISVPYFINSVEMIYRNIFSEAGASS